MEEETPRRPSVDQALAAVLAEDIPEDLDVKTVHLTIMFSGDVPYRLHPSDGGEYVGGVATVS